jgi:hypothetical protein
MTTPAETLREKLREAGCSVEFALQHGRISAGSRIELWLIHRPNSRVPVRAVVQDWGKDGYAVFLENASTLKVDDDVKAIIAAA